MSIFKHILLFTFIWLFLAISAFSQDTTSTTKSKTHNKAKTASIMSACLPGLGQIYNKKFWKLPIVYGGFAGLYYFHTMNNNEYKDYKLAYRFKSGDTTIAITQDALNLTNQYPLESLQKGKDYYKSNTDLLKIISFVFYILNIVDASVDAHLSDFDIDEDLTLRIYPISSPYYTGLSLALRFK